MNLIKSIYVVCNYGITNLNTFTVAAGEVKRSQFFIARSIQIAYIVSHRRRNV